MEEQSDWELQVQASWRSLLKMVGFGFLAELESRWFGGPTS